MFVDWYLPGYKAGGPIQSVANVVRALGSAFTIRVVTRNTDYGDPAPYAGIPVNRWVRQEHAEVLYLDERRISLFTIRRIIQREKPDFVYLNSLFSARFTLYPLLALRLRKHRPRVVLAPRGMLAPTALSFKRWKKTCFLRLAALLGLYDNLVWHAATTTEAEEIRRMFGPAVPVQVAENLIFLNNLPSASLLAEKDPRHRTFVFIARIHPIKNLHVAIGYFANVRPRSQVVFDIYGPIEDASYWARCQEAIEQVNGIEIRYRGELAHHDVEATLRTYHFFLFPTLNESFGHVVLEALGNGCPVIVSTNTPWRRLQEQGVGWDLPLDAPQAFVETIEAAIDMEEERYQTMAAYAITFARAMAAKQDRQRAHEALFQAP